MKGSFHTFLTAVLTGCVALLAAGCYDTKQDITLNSDGRGKVTIESTFIAWNPFAENSEEISSDESANVSIRRLIEESVGVDAWRDVTFRELEDGRVHFRGTAYFKDLSKLSVALSSENKFVVTKNGQGNLTVSVSKNTSDSRIPVSVPNEPLTSESLRRQRKQYRAIRPVLAGTLDVMSCETTFHFSGVVRRSSNFEGLSSSSLRHRFEGKRVLEVLDRLFDPAFADQLLAISSKSNSVTTDDFINEKLHGARGPILAVVAPGSGNRFDYDAEVVAARQSFRPVALSLGLTEETLTPAANGVDSAPAKVTVDGINWRFGRQTKEYTLSLIAEFPGAVLCVNEVEVKHAKTVEGTDLLGSSGRNSRFFSRGRPQTNFSFEVTLLPPSSRSQGIAEISGVLVCESMDQLRSVDLVSGQIKPGAKGSEFNTLIDNISKDSTGGERILVQTRLLPEEILSVAVVADSGVITKLEQERVMSIGSAKTYILTTPRSIPRSGRLVAQIYSGTKTVHFPFAVTNLNLLGQPLAAK